MPNPFYGKDIVSSKDFTRRDMEYLFTAADKLHNLSPDQRMKLGRGKVASLLFFEPSTRTRLSFEAAMQSIGGQVIGFYDTKGTSVEKGETLADTIRVVDGYCDAIVLRHPMEGAARFAAEQAEKPLINGGSGSEEHPTQSLLDVYSILSEKGRIDGLNIAVVGDLKYGRTVYSLLYALANYRPSVQLISPPQLKLRNEVQIDLGDRLKTTEGEKLEEIIHEVDVMYVTRIQKERFPDPAEYERVKGSYVIDLKLLEKAKRDLVILHPLPRTGEIKPEVDFTPNARYFAQAHRGKGLRAALFSLILNEDVSLLE